mmetsp:Transcript_1844/g.2926  ORF Transcript_1844/g.2926 Transcript_1844/m.2926 type:complete len:567 (+) Transcript_1844:64-1764(+)|eukprot:CAMPEP_0185027164 /NCGR_PEP_ID=MMETSP1103-20130426/11944_1 /TAXON_ID=36769 /ORGANISM="Paraphysomonas bandaiensis, Strain Caron Lab Isolate" /LENGTH=566 /DNA_ID=CAMNT_0027561037 /DNA_START=16 /DNA_END=1716 /DNA_ORIENTATION=-
MTSSSPHQLKYEDYIVEDMLQEGGWGKVYAAKHRTDGSTVAMKFFGYTKQPPGSVDIAHEIMLMTALEGVEGAVQLIGVFKDTASGLIPGKNPEFCQPYPVIVMEMLRGGDWLQRMSMRSSISEKDLSHSFRNAMLALRSIHRKGFVHRDLKLDNLMHTTPGEGGGIKIIDFGFMAALPSDGSGILETGLLVGTEGWFAPESILRHQYSTKSDVWQAGCVLYSMLAGYAPFHTGRKYRRQITDSTYYAMAGPTWEGVSESAKDLVRKMLVKDPTQRMDLDEVLSHPWITHCAPEKHLGEAYLHRIKHLALRGRLKKYFLANGAMEIHKERKEGFQHVLPFLRSRGSASDEDTQRVSADFSSRLLGLKELLVKEIYRSAEEDGKVVGEEKSSDKNSVRLLRQGSLGYEEFCTLVKSAQLDILANSKVFAVFDCNGDGRVDVKEVLMALAALRCYDNEEEEMEAVRLYFTVFDMDEDGFISEGELDLVVNCMLHDGTGPLLVMSDADGSAISVKDMFSAIDTNKDGRIDFSEFKSFYNAIILASHKSVLKPSSPSGDKMNSNSSPMSV